MLGRRTEQDSSDLKVARAGLEVKPGDYGRPAGCRPPRRCDSTRAAPPARRRPRGPSSSLSALGLAELLRRDRIPAEALRFERERGFAVLLHHELVGEEDRADLAVVVEERLFAHRGALEALAAVLLLDDPVRRPVDEHLELRTFDRRHQDDVGRRTVDLRLPDPLRVVGLRLAHGEQELPCELVTRVLQVGFVHVLAAAAHRLEARVGGRAVGLHHLLSHDLDVRAGVSRILRVARQLARDALPHHRHGHGAVLGEVGDLGEILGAAHGGGGLRQDLLALRQGLGRRCRVLLGGRRFGNRDVDLVHRAEGRQRRVELGRLADDQDRESVGPQVGGRGALDVVHGDGLDGLRELLEEVRRVVVAHVGHLPGDDRPLVGEVEDVRVQDPFLGALQLLWRDRLGLHLADLVDAGASRLDRGFRLGATGHRKHPGVGEPGAEPAADAVREPLVGAHLVEQPGAERSSEDLVHDHEGEVVGVLHRGAAMADEDVRLVDAFLDAQVDRRLGRRDLRNVRIGHRHPRPGSEHLPQLADDLLGVEVAPNRQVGVLRVVVLGVEVDEILPADAGEVLVLDLSRERVVRPVQDLVELASGDLARVVVAPGDDRLHLLDLEIDLVLREGGAYEAGRAASRAHDRCPR